MPVGFKTLTAFRYSTGFNDLLSLTEVTLGGELSRKVVWMGLHKTVIENYSISFILLLVSMTIMLGSIIYKCQK